MYLASASFSSSTSSILRFFFFFLFLFVVAIFHSYHAFNCFFGKSLHFDPSCVVAVFDGDDDTRHAIRSDVIVVRKCHWNDEIDGWEIALANIRVMPKLTHIKTVLLIWDTSMISRDKRPVSEIDVRSIQTVPFVLCPEMCFELIKHIPLEKRFEEFLFIKQINKG